MKQQIGNSADIAERIKPMLAGHGPAVQSIVLADLLATWIAGHHPDLRQAILTEHYELVRDLVAHNELEIFGPAGHPGRHQ